MFDHECAERCEVMFESETERFEVMCDHECCLIVSCIGCMCHGKGMVFVFLSDH